LMTAQPHADRLLQVARGRIRSEELEQIADVLATEKGPTAQLDAAKAREVAAQRRAERSTAEWKDG
jgi:hypothetical protein